MQYEVLVEWRGPGDDRVEATDDSRSPNASEDRDLAIGDAQRVSLRFFAGAPQLDVSVIGQDTEDAPAGVGRPTASRDFRDCGVGDRRMLVANSHKEIHA